MLRVSNVSLAFGAERVLDGVSFTLGPSERAGLVGPNGSGKSTLLQLIAGLIQPDTGSIWTDPNDTVAYLPQYPLDQLHLTARDALLLDSVAGMLKVRLADMEREMRAATGGRLDALLEEYAGARERFEHLGGYELDARMEEVIAGLALDLPSLDAPVAALSGGNKTKLSLGRLLLSRATILLLDEPTNYLDLRALLWLERFVAESNDSYLIVSHDRRFLDRTVGTILELDAASHTLREFTGTYSEYAERKLVERRKQVEAYADQQAEIRRIEADIRRTKEQARGVEARTKSGLGADHARRLAKKVAKKAKVRERRLERELTGAGMVEKPGQSWNLHLDDLGQAAIEGQRPVVQLTNVRAGYGDGDVLRGVDLEIRGGDRVALLGSNGSGKSTLVRCITGAIPCTGSVRVAPSVRIGLLSQETEGLPLDRTVLEVFRSAVTMPEDAARTYLHKFLFAGDAVHKPVSVLSYGQRAKLALAMMILSNANFLILDEPTSHMDMPALEAIEDALGAYRGPMLLITHDRYFLERVGVTRFEVMEAGRLHRVEGLDAYEEEMREGAS